MDDLVRVLLAFWDSSSVALGVSIIREKLNFQAVDQTVLTYKGTESNGYKPKQIGLTKCSPIY